MATAWVLSSLFSFNRPFGVRILALSLLGLGGFRGFSSQHYYTPRKPSMQKGKSKGEKSGKPE